jgi:hypothetical protein
MSAVRRMYSDHRDVLEYLREQKQASYHSALESTLPKVLLLAAASEFEQRVCAALLEFVREHSTDLKISALVEQKAIRRQYHTLFDWDKRTASKFWSLFGSDYKDRMNRFCLDDAELTEAISAFMEIGSLRNQMVHNDYATFVLEKTLDEVSALYEKGSSFLDRLPDLLKTQ